MNEDDYLLFQESPVEWIEEVFGEALWPTERTIANSVRDNRRTSVRSCHGSGKSYTAARIALWFLYCFPNSKVITTAPTARQVEDILWREIRKAKAQARFPLQGDPNQTSLSLSEDWFALGLSTDKPDRFQGFHAIHILLIVDEASGVAEEIFDASEGIVSSENARILYIGNPTNLGGTFYNSFKLPNYGKINISAFDTPNFTKFGITLDDIRANTWQSKITSPLPAPYLITPEWVFNAWANWGEESPMWQSRVLGEFPTQGDDTLIPYSKIVEATRREVEVKIEDPEQIGVDVARFGVDKTVFIYRKGPKVFDVQEFHHMDTMATAQKLFAFATSYPSSTINVDVIGIGAGVVDRIRQLLPVSQNVIDVNVGLPARDTERFANQRAEMYWALRERFIQGDIQIPNDDMLMSQLSSIKFKFTTRGQIQIESKEDMKKRGMPSPDRADALTLAFGRGGAQVSYGFLDVPQPGQMPTVKSQWDLNDPDQRKQAEMQADLDLIKQQNQQRR